MGEIVWMGRRRDTGEVEEVGRGPSFNVPSEYSEVWAKPPESGWPGIKIVNAPRTISELPEVVSESAPMDAKAWNRLGLGEPILSGSAHDGDPATFWQPATLTAAEVTEPGWYWYGEDGEWEVLEVWRETGRDRYIWRAGDSSPLNGASLPGTFIGPLRAPE